MKLNGDSLRTIRELREKTLRDLSEMTGLNIGYLSRIETGQRTAPQRTIESIATALDIPAAAISYPTLQVEPASIRRIVELLGATPDVVDEVMEGVEVG